MREMTSSGQFIKVPTVDDIDKAKEPTTSFSKFRKVEPITPRTSAASKILGNKPCDQKLTTNDESIEQKGRSSATSSNSDASTNRSVLVNGRQRGNPLLKFLRNVRWEWADRSVAPDYLIGESCCVLFLSVKYHKLNPEYLHTRLKAVGKSFAVQILLVLVDMDEPDNVVRELNTICFTAGWTLILCWSNEECAEYVESLKIYENKPPEFLMANKQEMDERSLLIDLLTSIRSVTKTDAENLIEAFGSLKAIAMASVDQLALCRGMGLLKAQRLHNAFGQPFHFENDVGVSTKEAIDVGIVEEFEVEDTV